MLKGFKFIVFRGDCYWGGTNQIWVGNVIIRLLVLKAKCCGSEVDLSPQMSKCRNSGVVSWAFWGTMAALLKQMGKLQCCFQTHFENVQTKTSWPAQCYISIIYLYLLKSFSNFVQQHLILLFHFLKMLAKFWWWVWLM